MDNRSHADSHSQNNSALPRRRLYVYDRPFASGQQQQRSRPTPQNNKQPTQPHPRQFADIRPAPPSRQPQTPQQSTPQQPPTQNIPPARQTPPSPPKQQQDMRPFRIEDTAPPQNQHKQQADPALASLDMPNEYDERQPTAINKPTKPQNNNGWHPVQQQPQQYPDSHLQARLPDIPQNAPHIEQQFAGNARKRRVTFLGRVKGIMPLGIKILLVCIVLGGVVMGVSQLQSGESVKDTLLNLNQPEEDAKGILNKPPDESQAATLGTSQVAGDTPKTVTIDAIDLASRVVTVGASRNSIVKAPANIFDIGWFEGSARPGQKGVVLLNGHIEGPTRPGALYEVAALKRGAKISVERGDGKVYNYTVQAVEFFENNQIDMSKLLTPYNPNRNGLNIMTAGGRYNTETNAYELRAAVYAVED